MPVFSRMKNSIAVVLCFGLFAQCGMFDFTRLQVSVDPGDRYSVVSPETGFAVHFSRQVDTVQAEHLVRVRVGGRDLVQTASWQGTTLTLVPVEAPVAGRVYEIAIEGSVRDARNRAHEVSMQQQIFYKSDVPPAHIASFEPADGVLSHAHADLVVRFSGPVDRKRIENSLVIYPAHAVELAWNDDGTVVRIVAEDGWISARTIELRLGDPDTVRYYVRYDADAHPLSASVDLEGDTIRLAFSADVDRHAVQEALRIRPYRHLTFQQETARTFTIAPEDSFETDTWYTLLLSAGLTATNGNVLREPYEYSFFTQPAQSALQHIDLQWTSGQLNVHSFDTSDSHIVAPDGPDYVLTASIAYSGEISSSADQHRILDSLQIQRLLPQGGAPVRLNYFGWDEPFETLSTLWSGLSPSGYEDTPAVYLLSVLDPRDGNAIGIVLVQEGQE